MKAKTFDRHICAMAHGSNEYAQFWKIFNSKLANQSSGVFASALFFASIALTALVKNAAIITIETTATTMSTIIAEVSFLVALFAT